MYRFLLTPRWMALHAVMIIALLVCLVLGWWQFGVYENSRDRQDVRDEPAVAVSELAQPGEPLGDARERPAVAEGRYLAEQQRLVPGRVHDNVLGSYVVTPLRLEDGMVVPVLRGWVDDADGAAATAVPPGPVTVEGHLLPPETSEHATVRRGQVLEPGQVAYIAPGRLAERAGVPERTALRGYLLLGAESPAPTAAPQPLGIDEVAPIRDVSPWQNLSYWAQWWVFGLAAVVFWASIVRSGVRTRKREINAPAVSHAPS
ncbi:cytochrome oxidase assembly protein ShyY1 [Haloactinopolyspora alba]|uniref:SURF1-like protein n=1 Tax=Haloactinopolyspora alba TaxID=648780 RepID=A0A2P8E2H2_9ACTN|nr:SURF1 family protein [Haloactinopolyspora alba]PSL03662.1 cytochrome oxidase assembly protein ShyY1 [Haloactinopolyspora alba]